MSRARMEARFGRIGAGARALVVAGTPYPLPELMARLGIGFEGCRGIDAFALGPAHFAVRYLDPDEQQVVAYEFDEGFDYLGETRAHVAEWVGEDALQGPSWTSTSS